MGCVMLFYRVKHKKYLFLTKKVQKNVKKIYFFYFILLLRAYMYIEKINSPKDLKKLSIKNLEILASEIRNAIIKKTSEIGGHLGSNLGVVELTIAIHYIFDAPKDKIVFDASHQTYTHKILTGRKDAFIDKRKYKNVKRFASPDESEFDLFKLGHTSTSLSLANGLAIARDLTGENGRVIAVIGDGALSGGEAYEGLNNIIETNTNTIVILNDNEMSIAENHGGIYKHINDLRKHNGKLSNNIFKTLGFDYYFLRDGHNLKKLIKLFKKIKDSKMPIFLHVCTNKGKGFYYAEQDKESFHSVKGFDIDTGKHKINKDKFVLSVTNGFLLEKMKKNKKIVYVSSGTPTMLGLTKKLRYKMGCQFIDTGICEQHAISMMAGLAKNGCKPVYGVFGTFLQRAYDQVVEDLCLNNLSATILLFKSSIYGMTSATHLGIFDNSILSNIPNLVMFAPTSIYEYLLILNWSLSQKEHTVAIKVPVFNLQRKNLIKFDNSNYNNFEIVQQGGLVAIIAVGTMFGIGAEILNKLKAIGISATLINPRIISEVDSILLSRLCKNHCLIVTIEDNLIEGGFGQKITNFYSDKKVFVKNYGLSKTFPDEYDPRELLKKNGITPNKIFKDINKLLHNYSK